MMTTEYTNDDQKLAKFAEMVSDATSTQTPPFTLDEHLDLHPTIARFREGQHWLVLLEFELKGRDDRKSRETLRQVTALADRLEHVLGRWSRTVPLFKMPANRSEASIDSRQTVTEDQE